MLQNFVAFVNRSATAKIKTIQIQWVEKDDVMFISSIDPNLVYAIYLWNEQADDGCGSRLGCGLTIA